MTHNETRRHRQNLLGVTDRGQLSLPLALPYASRAAAIWPPGSPRITPTRGAREEKLGPGNIVCGVIKLHSDYVKPRLFNFLNS